MLVTSDKTRQQECTRRVMAWLHSCWEITERGEPVQADPFYARNDKLTEKVVKDVLDGIELLMQREFDKFPGYHYPHQGVVHGEELLIPPGFNQLPYGEQFAIVQGIDMIFQDYRIETDPPPPVQTAQTQETAPPEEYWVGC